MSNLSSQFSGSPKDTAPIGIGIEIAIGSRTLNDVSRTDFDPDFDSDSDFCDPY